MLRRYRGLTVPIRLTPHRLEQLAMWTLLDENKKTPKCGFLPLFIRMFTLTFSAYIDVKRGCRHRRRHFWTVLYDQVIYTARCIAAWLGYSLSLIRVHYIITHCYYIIFIILYFFLTMYVYVYILRVSIVYNISMQIQTRSVAYVYIIYASRINLNCFFIIF